MMFPIKDGDMVVFMPVYGNAIVTPIPTTISSSAESTEVGGAAPCLEGDEEDVESQGCVYIAPPYVIPGTGTLKITSLGSDQTSQKTTWEDKKVILQGSVFNAEFEVQKPAHCGPLNCPSPNACAHSPSASLPLSPSVSSPSRLWGRTSCPN